MRAVKLVLFIVIFCSHVPANGQQSSPLTAAGVFQKVRSSIVIILGSSANQSVQGSGFIIGPNRIITNHHVVNGLDRTTVVFADGGRTTVSGLLLDSPDEDFSVLEAQTGSRKPLVLGDELSLREGDPVVAIGAPRGLELTISNGIVSGFRTIGSRLLIQNTAPTSPGSSGGPLLDMRGRVVGITTLGVKDSPGIYFSVGIGAARRLLLGQGTAATSLSGATRKDGSGRGVSLEETFDWIKNKLESVGNTNAPNTLIDLEVGEKGTVGLRAASRTALQGGLFVLDHCDSGVIRRDGVGLSHGQDACVFILQYRESLPTCRHESVNLNLFHGTEAIALMNTPHVGCEESWEGSFTVTMDMRFLKNVVPFVDPKALLRSYQTSTSLTGVVLTFDGAGAVTTHESASKISFSDCQLKTIAQSLPADTDEHKFIRTVADSIKTEGSETISDLKDSLVSIPVNGGPEGFAPPEGHGELATRIANAFEHVGELCTSRRPRSTEPF